jgi:hypothetical protein
MHRRTLRPQRAQIGETRAVHSATDGQAAFVANSPFSFDGEQRAHSPSSAPACRRVFSRSSRHQRNRRSLTSRLHCPENGGSRWGSNGESCARRAGIGGVGAIFLALERRQPLSRWRKTPQKWVSHSQDWLLVGVLATGQKTPTASGGAVSTDNTKNTKNTQQEKTR